MNVIAAKFLVHLLLLLLVNQTGQYNLVRRDPFASLGETLHTRQRAACDDENLSLECPAGSKIAIQLVRYGREAPSEQVCPPTPSSPRPYTGREGLACSIPEAVRTVEELCQSKQSCSILTGVTAFGLNIFDPCPGVRKYAEVAYKCQPATLSSRQLCGGAAQVLRCPQPHHNIAIVSGQFRSAAEGPLYCPIQSGSFLTGQTSDAAGAAMKECTAVQVTPPLVALCHGRKECRVTASPNLLAAAPCTGLHIYLKLVFACVDPDIFLPKFVPRDTDQQENFKTQERHFMPPNIPEEMPRRPPATNSTITVEHRNQQIEVVVTPVEVDVEEHSLLWRLLSSFLQIQRRMSSAPAQVALVFALTIGLALCLALAALVARLCWASRRSTSLSRDLSPSHMDLDNDAIDYDLACHQLQPLPPPKLMVGGEGGREEWGLVNTLTRARGRQTVARLAPLEDYLGPSEEGRSARYSTIGRGGGASRRGEPGPSTPSPPPPCCQDGEAPRSLHPMHGHNEPYY